jgi:anti-sigma-K factor RskA
MSTPTHPGPRPAVRGGVDSRLPWWALVLPVLAFAALLALILDPAKAHATTADPAVTHLVERIRHLIGR